MKANFWSRCSRDLIVYEPKVTMTACTGIAMQLGLAIANRVGEMKSHIIIIPIKYLILGFQFPTTL